MVFKLQYFKVDYIETETQLKTAKFQVLKTAFCWYLWALFDHVRHWISSWPLNKVCYPWQELQLLFRLHSHANTLSYCSTLVKLVSWKWHFKWNQHLESNLFYVMNINIVPIIILDVSKVFSWPHNHFIHWSHMITSISIYIKSTFHVIRYQNEMKFLMLMFMNAWMMLMLMKCRRKCNA